jgi:hypothetical protein
MRFVKFVAALLIVAGLAAPVLAQGTFSGLPPASQPLGNVPDFVPLDQGTGCPTNTAPCTTSNSPSLRIGQPIVSSTAPSSPFQYQLWINTSKSPPLLQEYLGSTWATIGALDTANGIWTPPVGGGAVTTLASAGTVDLGSVPQAGVAISGTNAISSFGTSAAVGTIKFLTFSGASSLVYNATSMILPGAANISVAANDTAIVQYLGSGNWIVLVYQRASGSGTIIGVATLASATTVDLGSVPQNLITITGTATIASFGSSAAAGTVKYLTFQSALTLTYNATSMIVPGVASIVTGAGDTAMAQALGSGNWIVTAYQRASGGVSIQSLPVTTGSANAQIAAVSGAPAPLQGTSVQVIAGFTNTAAATFSFNSSTPEPVYQDSTAGPVALVGGEIQQYNRYVLSYDTAIGGSAGNLGWHLAGAVNASNALTGTILADNITSAPGLVSYLAPHVATEAALVAIATAIFPNGVWRDDFSAGFGAPPLFYTPQTGTCAANGYISDGGSCANTTAGDGNSWIAHFYQNRADVREWGCAFNNSTDISSCLQTAIRDGSEALGLQIVYPAGGKYVISSTVTGGGGPINIDFNNSSVTVKTTGWGYDFPQSAVTNPVNLRGPAWFTANNASAASGCIEVTFPSIGSFAHPTLMANKIYCLSSGLVTTPYPNSFTEGLLVGGTWYADLEDIWYNGPFTGGPPITPVTGTHAIEFGGNNNYGATVSRAISIYADEPIYFSAYSEGTIINDMTDVLSNIGIEINSGITPVGGAKCSGLTVNAGSNFFSWHGGLDADKCNAMNIQGAFTQAGYDGVTHFTGISDSNGSASLFHARITGTDPVDTGSIGISLSGSASYNQVGGTLASVNTGVNLGASTTYNNGTFTYQHGTVTTLVIDSDTARTNNVGPQEGRTFNMVLAGSVTAGTFTAAGNEASYEIDGRRVTLRGTITGTLSGASGNIIITPLPYPTANESIDVGQCSITSFEGITALTSGYTFPLLNLGAGATSISVLQAGINEAIAGLAVGALSGTIQFGFTCNYDAW